MFSSILKLSRSSRFLLICGDRELGLRKFFSRILLNMVFVTKMGYDTGVGNRESRLAFLSTADECMCIVVNEELKIA
ncbi:hypothetical protein HZ326_23173 [Fusarium oxysporum f. sp. albedinis]|nr:hypothetical protein HZ326_23173 [Fusarium oxysporum f. sp. albedinis]